MAVKVFLCLLEYNLQTKKKQYREDDMIKNMWTVFVTLLLVGGTFAFDGGRVSTDIRLTINNSPYIIEHDIIIETGARLAVDPGVEMRFAPQIMVGVNGTFYAKVKYS